MFPAIFESLKIDLRVQQEYGEDAETQLGHDFRSIVNDSLPKWNGVKNGRLVDPSAAESDGSKGLNQAEYDNEDDSYSYTSYLQTEYESCSDPRNDPRSSKYVPVTSFIPTAIYNPFKQHKSKQEKLNASPIVSKTSQSYTTQSQLSHQQSKTPTSPSKTPILETNAANIPVANSNFFVGSSSAASSLNGVSSSGNTTTSKKSPGTMNGSNSIASVAMANPQSGSKKTSFESQYESYPLTTISQGFEDMKFPVVVLYPILSKYLHKIMHFIDSENIKSSFTNYRVVLLDNAYVRISYDCPRLLGRLGGDIDGLDIRLKKSSPARKYLNSDNCREFLQIVRERISETFYLQGEQNGMWQSNHYFHLPQGIDNPGIHNPGIHNPLVGAQSVLEILEELLLKESSTGIQLGSSSKGYYSGSNIQGSYNDSDVLNATQYNFYSGHVVSGPSTVDDSSSASSALNSQSNSSSKETIENFTVDPMNQSIGNQSIDQMNLTKEGSNGSKLTTSGIINTDTESTADGSGNNMNSKDSVSSGRMGSRGSEIENALNTSDYAATMMISTYQATTNLTDLTVDYRPIVDDQPDPDQPDPGQPDPENMTTTTFSQPKNEPRFSWPALESVLFPDSYLDKCNSQKLFVLICGSAIFMFKSLLNKCLDRFSSDYVNRYRHVYLNKEVIAKKGVEVVAAQVQKACSSSTNSCGNSAKIPEIVDNLLKGIWIGNAISLKELYRSRNQITNSPVDDDLFDFISASISNSISSGSNSSYPNNIGCSNLLVSSPTDLSTLDTKITRLGSEAFWVFRHLFPQFPKQVALPTVDVLGERNAFPLEFSVSLINFCGIREKKRKSQYIKNAKSGHSICKFRRIRDGKEVWPQLYELLGDYYDPNGRLLEDQVLLVGIKESIASKTMIYMVTPEVTPEDTTESVTDDIPTESVTDDILTESVTNTKSTENYVKKSSSSSKDSTCASKDANGNNTICNSKKKKTTVPTVPTTTTTVPNVRSPIELWDSLEFSKNFIGVVEPSFLGTEFTVYDYQGEKRLTAKWTANLSQHCPRELKCELFGHRIGVENYYNQEVVDNASNSSDGRKSSSGDKISSSEPTSLSISISNSMNPSDAKEDRFSDLNNFARHMNPHKSSSPSSTGAKKDLKCSPTLMNNPASLMNNPAAVAGAVSMSVAGAVSMSSKVAEDKNYPRIFGNVAPTWNNSKRTFMLPFFGRVKLASSKNFQLCSIIKPEMLGNDGLIAARNMMTSVTGVGGRDPKECGNDHLDTNNIRLLFGKIKDQDFALDFGHPFTLLDAFGLGIANVAKKRIVT